MTNKMIREPEPRCIGQYGDGTLMPMPLFYNMIKNDRKISKIVGVWREKLIFVPTTYGCRIVRDKSIHR